MRELVVSKTEYYINKSLNLIGNNTRISGTYVILQELLANDEVETPGFLSSVHNLHPTRPSDSSTSPHESRKSITYPSIMVTGFKMEASVLSRRNEVLRRSKWVAGGPKREGENFGGFSREFCQTRRRVSCTAGRCQEFTVGRGRDIDQSRAGVDHSTRTVRGQRHRSVFDRGNVNPPEGRVWEHCALGEVRRRSGVLGSVDTAEGELAILVIVVGT